MLKVVVCFVCVFVCVWAKRKVIKPYRKEICCDRLGCFNNDPPFNHHMELPECPENLDMTFHLFKRELGDGFQIATRDIIPPAFDPAKRTVIFTHGWLGSKDYLEWMVGLRKGFLQHGDYNVIQVDWMGGSVDVWYPKSVANTRTVGGEMYLLGKNLVEKGGARWDNMWYVGHSLGAHACGFAGKRTNGQLQRLTGLDPAGPSFNSSSTRTRLHKTDAKFVDVIHSHTDDLVLTLGIARPIGAVDFFPNGIGMQPGCLTGIEDIVTCSHHRSIHYLSESLNTPTCRFKAYPCRSKEDAENGKCNKCTPNCQYMGVDADNHPGRGPYYLTTNDEQPYCRNGEL